jgi:hypothetical protein
MNMEPARRQPSDFQDDAISWAFFVLQPIEPQRDRDTARQSPRENSRVNHAKTLRRHNMSQTNGSMQIDFRMPFCAFASLRESYALRGVPGTPRIKLPLQACDP